MNDLFGMVFWGIAFYAVNAVVHFTFMDMIMTPVSVALVNTIFRVATVCVLFPFIPKLEALVCRLVKDTKEEWRMSQTLTFWMSVLLHIRPLRSASATV